MCVQAAFQGKAALCGEPRRWIPGVQFVEPYSKSPSAPSITQSPLSHVDNLNTPTLLLHGEKDVDVPVDCGCARTLCLSVCLSVYRSKGELLARH